MGERKKFFKNYQDLDLSVLITRHANTSVQNLPQVFSWLIIWHCESTASLQYNSRDVPLICQKANKQRYERVDIFSLPQAQNYYYAVNTVI